MWKQIGRILNTDAQPQQDPSSVSLNDVQMLVIADLEAKRDRRSEFVSKKKQGSSRRNRGSTSRSPNSSDRSLGSKDRLQVNGPVQEHSSKKSEDQRMLRTQRKDRSSSSRKTLKSRDSAAAPFRRQNTDPNKVDGNVKSRRNMMKSQKNHFQSERYLQQKDQFDPHDLVAMLESADAEEAVVVWQHLKSLKTKEATEDSNATAAA